MDSPKNPEIELSWRDPRTLGIAGALALVVWYAVANWNSFPATPAPADALDAYTACTRFVDDRLKAPASARHQEYRDVAISHPAGGGFRVRGYVDSQNSFGAMLRSRWECEVAFEGRTARLKHLAID